MKDDKEKDDVIHIYDSAGLNKEPTFDELMGELVESIRSDRILLLHTIDQMSEIKQILESEGDKDLQRIVNDMIKTRECLLPSPDSINQIERLQNRNPIAAPLLFEVIQQIHLFKMGHNLKSFCMKPILVVGKPGIGKTYTIQRIAGCLGLECAKIDISMGNEAFFLSGSQRGYANTTPGEVARQLANCKSPNPVFVLDELDKGVFYDGHRQPMTAPLLALLERETSSEFYDASLRLNIDASYISWMATANDASKIPKPLLERFIVVEFENPTPDHMQKILCSITSELLKERHLTHLFVDASKEFVMESVKYNGRELKYVLEHAIARRVHDISKDYTIKLELIDLKRLAKNNEKRGIGFIQ